MVVRAGGRGPGHFSRNQRRSIYADSSYQLALDFTNQSYWRNGTSYAALSSMPGYTSTRSGTVGFVDTDGGVDSFAANTPAINGYGYHSYGALTNYIRDSANISGIGAVLTNVTATANTVAAPDGTTTADMVTASAGSAEHYATQASSEFAAGNLTYSVFIAKGGHRYVRLHDGASISGVARFDLQDGTVTNINGTGYLVDCGTYWRLVATYSSGAATTTSVRIYFSDAAGNLTITAAGTESLGIWGQQTILGTFPDGGPYIPTAGATASIGASVLSVSDGPADATQLFWSVIDFPGSVGTNRYAAWWGNATDYVMVGFQGAFVVGQAYVGGVAQLNQSAAGMTSGRFALLVLRSGGNWRAGYIKNGVLTWLSAAVAGTFPTMSTNYAGAASSGSSTANSPVRGIFRKTLTDTSDAAIVAAVGSF